MTDMASHPIILHADLHAEDERAPQTQFVVERQVAFLEALATTGSVRAAARRARVSHQTCYRARRASAGFGRAWDAALVVARGAAEAKLADYAMNGIEEEVWYHGEHRGERRRFSDRLLLAHLARLDRMRGDVRIEALAEDFDGMILRLRRGEPIEPEVADPDPAEPAQEGCGTSRLDRVTGGPCLGPSLRQSLRQTRRTMRGPGQPPIRGRILGAVPPSLRSYGPLRARGRACLACGSGPAQYRALVNGVLENRAGGGPARATARPQRVQLAADLARTHRRRSVRKT